MRKDPQNLPQEFQNQKGRPIDTDENETVSVEENDIYTDSSIIIGGGDPNLSPDAGKPLI